MRPRRGRLRAIIVSVVVVLVVAALALSRFYTDVLWFREVGLSSVLWKSLSTQALLGAAGGLALALLVYVNLVLAARIAPPYRVPRLEVVGRPDPFERYRETIAPYLKWIRLAVAVFIGLLLGLGAGSGWRTFLLWSNREEFGQTDPQFGKDVGFYVFELPFFDLLLSWAWFALIVVLIVSVAAHYFHGSIRPEAGWSGVHSGALAHVSVLLGLLALVKAAQYWLGQYELNFSERGTVTGASYTDVHAQLPALKLLAVISIISALLFLVNIRVRRLTLPLAAVGIWVLTAVLAGGVWPAVVQRFSVSPQELPKEREFIARNIAATREAFNVDQVSDEPFALTADLSNDDLEANQALLQNVRLWDPSFLQTAYQQLQSIRPYYDFTDVDIDRYEIDGEQRQVLLSPREINIDGIPDKTWTNLHLQYTHGYGVVASLANEITASGQPEFLVRDVEAEPQAGAEDLEIDQKGVYYGENFESSQYSIVNSGQTEIDYPTEGDVERTNYAGEGGVPIGGFLQQFAFAIREGDPNLVLSSLVEPDSKILLYRNVRDRVQRAAPFLSLDHDTYSAVVDGRLVWIMDGYTSTPWYPYSQRFDMDDIVAREESGTLADEVNYVRNSVKIVVDAYDGTMDFYVVDEEDPLIRAWRNVFPDLFTDEEPSDDLQAHFRYPEDLFDAQSEVYLTYHMTDPGVFYAKEDQWEVPDNPNPSDDESGELPSRYLLAQLPGEPEEEFVLTRPFTPREKNNMISLMVARSDPESYGELLTLQFSRNAAVLGPTQVDNLINQDPEISETLTLLGQQGSTVQWGAQVILPIEDSILYVQPLFVVAENVGIPELKYVALVYNEQVVMQPSFEEALADLFGVPAAPDEPDEPDEPQPPGDGGDGGEQPPSDGGGDVDARVQELIAEAARLYERAQQALTDGDLEEYARLIERLGRLLEQAEQLSGGDTGGTGGGPPAGSVETLTPDGN
jgi:uncharacterized membrane protein (UPF0182 family)